MAWRSPVLSHFPVLCRGLVFCCIFMFGFSPAAFHEFGGSCISTSTSFFFPLPSARVLILSLFLQILAGRVYTLLSLVVTTFIIRFLFIMSSNSSTAGSNVYSSDMAEATFLKRNRVLHIVQLALSILITIASAAMIACEVVPFRHYKSTVGWASTGLALWPLNFDLRPTIAALSCGCVIVFLNLIYVVMALIPSVCSILSHWLDRHTNPYISSLTPASSC